MVISKSKFYGYKLKQEILQHENFSNIDPFFFKAFCKSINSLPDIDEDIFLDYIEYNFDLIDKICFYYLTSNLGNKILSKDPYYIAELCTSLTINNISFQNFIPISIFLLNDPIYTIINEINNTSQLFGCINIFNFIIQKFNIPNIKEDEIKAILKLLNILLNKEYSILLKQSTNLEDIKNTLYQKMLETNNKELIYTAKDFKTISFLKYFNIISDEECKSSLLQELIDCETNNYDTKVIIKNCLNIIEKYRSMFINKTLIRRNPNEK